MTASDLIARYYAAFNAKDWKAMLAAAGQMAFQIHGDRRIAALVPRAHPIGIRSAAAAVSASCSSVALPAQYCAAMGAPAGASAATTSNTAIQRFMACPAED